MLDLLTQSEIARALLVLLSIITLTEWVLDKPFRLFLNWAHAKTNPHKKDYRWVAFIGVSLIAASFGATQFGIFGFGMTFAISYYAGAVILSLAFVLQNNLPGVKLEVLLIVAGVFFNSIAPEGAMANDMSRILWLKYFGVLAIALVAFQIAYLFLTKSGLDEKLQRWSLSFSERTANAFGVVGTCSIVTAFVMSQISHPAFGLEPGLTFTLLNTLGSMGWAVILMRAKLVDNLSLEAVFTGFGLVGVGSFLLEWGKHLFAFFIIVGCATSSNAQVSVQAFWNSDNLGTNNYGALVVHPKGSQLLQVGNINVADSYFKLTATEVNHSTGNWELAAGIGSTFNMPMAEGKVASAFIHAGPQLSLFGPFESKWVQLYLAIRPVSGVWEFTRGEGTFAVSSLASVYLTPIQKLPNLQIAGTLLYDGASDWDATPLLVAEGKSRLWIYSLGLSYLIN